MVTLIRSSAQPAKKTAAKKAAAPVKKAAARPVYDDDDDEEPAPRSARRQAADDNHPTHTPQYVRGGNSEATAVMTSGSGFANALKLKDGEEQVIRFLEDAPYASMRIHWLERKGKRSYPCPGDPRKDVSANGCPLCAYNMSFQKEARYNVALLSEEDPIVMSLNVSPKTWKKITAHGDSKHGPLSRKFYFYRRSGTGFETEYTFEVVRAPGDIAEDYPKLYVPSEDEIDALTRFTAETANKEFAPLSEMRKVANEIVTGVEDDE